MPVDRRTLIRRAILGGMLAAVAAAFAIGELDRYRLEVDLARASVPHYAPDIDRDARTATMVTVARDPILIGTARGKVEVYIADEASEDATPSMGLEYYFEREAGTWTLTESGRCSGSECKLRGREAFARQRE